MLMMFYYILLYILKQTVSDYRRLHQWSIIYGKWNLILLRKCEFLWITNKRNPVIYQYSINDTVIQQVAHAKYLGVIID